MIVFVWSGFPQYGARCVGAFVKAHPEKEVLVIATRPRVPIKGMEALCDCRIRWINGGASDLRELSDFDFAAVEVLFVDGWYVPAFNMLRQRVAALGGRVFCMLDNNLQFYRGSYLKELVKALRFRLQIRRHFEGYLVPGQASIRLLRFYGVDADKITTGFYSADPTLFGAGRPMRERQRKIIYVGQLNDRKNVALACEAFCRSGIAKLGWSFDLYGSGPLREKLGRQYATSRSGVAIHSFVQPEELAALYQTAQAFILASKEEHWGLVVHEAALSGCYLMLSERVGAKDDFLGHGNGRSFNPLDIGAIENAFRTLAGMPNENLEEARTESLRMAARVSLNSFVRGVENLLK